MEIVLKLHDIIVDVSAKLSWESVESFTSQYSTIHMWSVG